MLLFKKLYRRRQNIIFFPFHLLFSLQTYIPRDLQPKCLWVRFLLGEHRLGTSIGCSPGDVGEATSEGFENEQNSFAIPSVASPTSHLILQSFRRRFTYVTGTSFTSPGEPPMRTRTVDRYTREGLPEICDQQNVRATVRDSTGQNTKDTTGRKIAIKIPDLAGNQTRAAVSEHRDYTDHSMATGQIIIY